MQNWINPLGKLTKERIWKQICFVILTKRKGLEDRVDGVGEDVSVGSKEICIYVWKY
jgi:hypothetical protein